MPPLTEINDLYHVANDWETDVLDALRKRAGHIWVCDGPHQRGQAPSWTNLRNEPCAVCGARNVNAVSA